MKKSLYALLIAVFFFHAPITLAEELSCKELQEITDTLDQLADLMAKLDPGDMRDDEADKVLGDLSQGLKEMAEQEESDGLSDAADLMLNAWNTEGPWTEDQLSDFKLGLDSAVMNISRIHHEECK
ncbi:MAG: hypothetical protein HQL47_07580 [Gammaproteobacteria bacterium]|nr:hypothetical protein [Gammaproteobacteria bacterium]